MPLSSFLSYLRLEKHYSPHTIKAYDRDITAFKAFIKKEFDVPDLVLVVYPMIRNWIVSLSDNGLSNRSINRKISSLKSFYKFLVQTQQLEVTPLAKHRALKTATKVQIPFSSVEVETVLDELREVTDFESLRNLVLVELLYGTGMRRQELINLNLSSIDFENNTIKILGKRNKERIVPLLPTIQERRWKGPWRRPRADAPSEKLVCRLMLDKNTTET